MKKLRYLGTLGSIGASKFQRISVVYREGILEGLIGIPVGIGVGILLTNGIVNGLENIFMYEQPLVVELTFGRIGNVCALGISDDISGVSLSGVESGSYFQ